MKNVVIIGAGFGGLFVARHLMNREINITLIDSKNYFLFTPLLVEFAFGTKREETVRRHLSEIVGKNVKFIQGVVKSIDLKNNVVRYDRDELKYDYLVVSAGCTTEFYGIEGAEEFSIPFMNIENCYKTRNRIEEVLKSASSTKKEINLVVVGGGATGISVVCGLKRFCEKLAREFGIDKDLINVSVAFMEDKPLGLLGVEKISELAEKRLKGLGIKIYNNSAVSKVGKNFIELGGQKLPADATIWAAGIKPNKIETIPNVLQKGHMEINEFLQIGNFSNAYSLGDCSLSKEKFPKTAQVASQQARIIAENIISSIGNGNLKEFVYNHKGTLMCLGNFYGIVQIGNFVFSGFLAWLLWKFVHMIQFHSMGRKLGSFI